MSTVTVWLARLSEHGPSFTTTMLLAKITLLLAASWCVHCLLRRANPRWSVLLWRSTAAGALLLIALSAAPPLLSWGVLPASGEESAVTARWGSEQLATQTATAADAAVTDEATPSAPDLNHLGPAPWDGRRDEGASSRRHSYAQPPVVIVQDAPSEARLSSRPMAAPAQSGPAPTAKAPPLGAVSESAGAAWQSANRGFDWFAGLWLAGCVLLVARTCCGLFRMRAAKPVFDTRGFIRKPLGNSLCPFEDRCLVGFWQPIVLLPAGECDSGRREELRAILAHEAAHLNGRDLPWNASLHVLSLLLWFHPLAWRIRSAHAGACDAVADAVAAESVGDVGAYGRTLARLAVRTHNPTPAATLAMARTSNVRQRIEALQRRLFREHLPRRQVVAAAALSLLALTTLGTLALTRAEADSNPAATDTQTAAAKPNDLESSRAAVASIESSTASDKAPKVATVSLSKDAEPETMNRFRVHVVSAEAGESLAGVDVQFTGSTGKRVRETVQTNEEGDAVVAWDASQSVSYLYVRLRKAGFVPQYHQWSSDRKPVHLPEQTNVRLEKAGPPVGGIVQDEAGNPIAGATLDLSMAITWPKLDSHVFTAGALETDAEGRWQFDMAPSNGQLSVRVEHPDYIATWGKKNASLDVVTVLTQGPELTGRVIGPDGKPVAGARVIEGFDDWGNHAEGTTDDEGRFVLKNCESGKSSVTVQADGYAPAVIDLTIAEENEPLEFRLQKGNVLRVRVVDLEGVPIEKALVAPESWRGYHTVRHRMRTKGDGRIEWDGAPPDGVEYSILKQGYMARRDLVLIASDKEHVVTLHPQLIISGTVTDKSTGQGVPQFRIRCGHDYTGRDTYWKRDEPVAYEQGAYEYKFDEPINGGYLLQVEAPGYAPETSRPFKPHEGAVSFDLALEPASDLSGTILTAAGEPAAKAEVGLATVESRAFLKRGRFDRNQNSAEVVETDETGKFAFLPRDDEPFLLIVVHDSGFAEVTHEQFAESQEIHLQPWGQIEGQVLLGNRPDANREVSFHPRRPRRKGMSVFYGYVKQTDVEGRFRFDRVMPGAGTVARVAVTKFLSSTQHAPGWPQQVEIQPHETTHVTIGGTGQPVVGRVELDRTPDVSIDWTNNEPAAIERRNVDNNRTAEISYRCLGNIDKTGRLEIPDVPPGDYKLAIPVNNPPSPNSCGAGKAIGRTEYNFTVPELPGGRSDEPLDLGVVIAELFDTLDAGEFAPDFVAEKLTGGQVRLGDLHGKLVVLDFWATWCGPCLAEMPALAQLQQQFGSDERFVLLSVSCDNQIEAPREYFANNDIGWLHAHVRGMNSSSIRDYTVRALPALFLLGPDGRVMAKNLKGPERERAIAAALADDELFQRASEVKRPSRFPVVRFAPDEEASLASRPAIVVLDNCDPSFDKEITHTDGLRLLSSEGQELRVLREFNNCQTVGGMHGVVVDAKRNRIYLRENVSDRVHCFDTQGRKLWQVENTQAGVLAVDPQIGHLWVSGGSRLNEGETVVLDERGEEIAAYPHRAVDMAYDPHSDAFWLVGYDVIKLSRDGKVLFQKPVDGWCCASVSINPNDGSVWFIERDHPDVARSRNRLWKLDAQGNVLVERDLDDLNVFAVECDPRTGEPWVAVLNDDLLRFSGSGEPAGNVSVRAYNLAAGPDGLWVATKEAVLRLDETGQVAARYDFDRPSGQTWLAVLGDGRE